MNWMVWAWKLLRVTLVKVGKESVLALDVDVKSFGHSIQRASIDAQDFRRAFAVSARHL